jgi:hypothetical protein
VQKSLLCPLCAYLFQNTGMKKTHRHIEDHVKQLLDALYVPMCFRINPMCLGVLKIERD